MEPLDLGTPEPSEGSGIPELPPPERIRKAVRGRSAGSWILLAVLLLLAVYAGSLADSMEWLTGFYAILAVIPILLVVRFRRETAWLRGLVAEGASGHPDPGSGTDTRKDRTRARKMVKRHPVFLSLGTGFVTLLLAVATTPLCACGDPPPVDSILRSNLRNLQTAQEMYYAGPGAYRYADDVDRLDDFSVYEGVTIGITSADLSTGYMAVASHFESGITCSVQVGVGEEDRSAPATEGGPACIDASDGSRDER